VSRGEALKAAGATRTLGGKTPRTVPVFAVVVLATLPAAAAIVLLAREGLERYEVVLGLLIVSLVSLATLLHLVRRAVLRYNAAAIALHSGDFDAAAAGLRALLARPATEQLVAFALYNLAGLGRRRGEDDGDGLVLLRAALAVERTRFRRTTGTIEDMMVADLALALAVAGDLGEADAVLSSAPHSSYTSGIALLARSRAFVALRRGKPEDALAVLDAERALLRNTLGASDDALVQAIEAVALARTGGVYRGSPRAAHPIDADAEARVYVTRLLPEAEGSFATA
jgi:hypothetical protein